jgi:cytochrome b561
MQPRYSKMNQALHWLTAACMVAILPLAWVMTNADSGKFHQAADLYNWHKTLGGLVLLLTAFRLVWRFRDGPPAYPPQVARWDRLFAHAVYWLFFAALLWMPITGEIMTLYGRHPTVLFDIIPTPQILTPNDALEDFWGELHSWGQWAVYALLLLHVAGVAFHLIWGKDGVLGRMLPAYSGEPPVA